MQPRKERALPLEPEAFTNVSVFATIRDVAFTHTPPTEASLAKFLCSFFPELDVSKYLASRSDAEQSDLNERSHWLANRATDNELSQVSEFRWEVCAWNDVFGKIMDDQSVLVDKRPYEFLEGDKVKWKTPDATMGLRTYDAFELKQGYKCTVKGCRIDHSSKTPDVRLSQERLLAMMHHPDCGLLVDGHWGYADCVFPFAVYEAKKDHRYHENAMDQIKHACQTYMSLLDDLARDPVTNLSTYQGYEKKEPEIGESTDVVGFPRYQMFAFTSSGPYWTTMEKIWIGDVRNADAALVLLCLVDQIHDYAQHRHRKFVMQHLHAWYVWFRSQGFDTKKDVYEMSAAAEDRRGRKLTAQDHENFRQELQEQLEKSRTEDVRQPAWKCLLQSSKGVRLDLAAVTQDRKRKREVDDGE
ncbi:hypothetical protein SEUCBS140593_003004 [Sporothrix eucalyptigena]|uniref:Uncharacterized protein n=1 Tax=Sporothrix eucalyptigena TaxID=1812306 RepID=A0ABP0BBJ4_9PEZI